MYVVITRHAVWNFVYRALSAVYPRGYKNDYVPSRDVVSSYNPLVYLLECDSIVIDADSHVHGTLQVQPEAVRDSGRSTPALGARAVARNDFLGWPCREISSVALLHGRQCSSRVPMRKF